LERQGGGWGSSRSGSGGGEGGREVSRRAEGRERGEARTSNWRERKVREFMEMKGEKKESTSRTTRTEGRRWKQREKCGVAEEPLRLGITDYPT